MQLISLTYNLKFQSINQDKEVGRNLTNKYWRGSRQFFDNQLKSKTLELFDFYIQNACYKRDSDVLKVNCCTGYCIDCDWVKNCDQYHQHHGESYSKSSTRVAVQF